MLNHETLHKCKCHQDTQVHNCVIVSSDLQPYVLDTQVKRRAELSPDHHLVISWIRWQRRTPDRPGKPSVNVLWRCAESAWQRPQFVRSLTPTSGRTSKAFQGRLGKTEQEKGGRTALLHRVYKEQHFSNSTLYENIKKLNILNRDRIKAATTKGWFRVTWRFNALKVERVSFSETQTRSLLYSRGGW